MIGDPTAGSPIEPAADPRSTTDKEAGIFHLGCLH